MKKILNSKFICSICDFKAKSSRDLKTHIGRMHKGNAMVTGNDNYTSTITEASTSSCFQVFTSKLCGKEFSIKDDSMKHAYAVVILKPVDMTPNS